MKRLQKADKAMLDAQERVKLGAQLKLAAIDAMMHGIGSDQWKSYMSLFADTTDQLERLTVEKGTDELWLRESRAYMVANAICGADSTTRTSLRVAADIDDDLNPDDAQLCIDPVEGQPVPVGKIARPFVIPTV